MDLSEHFTLAEMVESETATRMGIDNTPSDIIIENLTRTAQLGEAIRTALSEEANREVYITVLSGYRCEALEKALCANDYLAWCQKNLLDDPDVCWQQYFAKKGHPKGQCMDFHAPVFGDPYHIVHRLTQHTEIIGQIDQIILEGATAKTQGWVHVGWSQMPRHQIMTAIFDDAGVPHYFNKLT